MGMLRYRQSEFSSDSAPLAHRRKGNPYGHSVVQTSASTVKTPFNDRNLFITDVCHRLHSGSPPVRPNVTLASAPQTNKKPLTH